MRQQRFDRRTGKDQKQVPKKSYLDDPEGEISRTLTATNAEHQEILELFKEYKADEVSKIPGRNSLGA